MAPPFPRGAPWVNSPALEMAELRGRPVLIEFWDFCRPNSLRTLPYLKAWHERYGAAGLVVVSVHAPGFRASTGENAVRAAVARLGIEHAVLLDSNFALWRDYENAGWPGRYL
ncbi:MAG TPA: DipZ protein, partial [Methylomirabilota bacterium]